MPGKLLAYITDFPRVVGGIDQESTRRAVALYQTIVKETVSPTDVLTAEMSKVIENAYRDVNIAFANEIALACERMGVDVFEIRDLINARPDRNVHTPGAGVGGHCLPKDSWLLKYGVETYGRGAEGPGNRGAGERRSKRAEGQGSSEVREHESAGAEERWGHDSESEIRGSTSQLRLISLAREINDAMPAHMLDLIEDALAEAGRDLQGAEVALLGVAHLEDADDTRNTPAAKLAALLAHRGARVVAHDPHVRVHDWQRSLDDGLDVPLVEDLEAALAGADCAAIVTRHRQYSHLTPDQFVSIMRTPVIVDGRNVFGAPDDGHMGLVIRSVGKPYA